MIDCEPRQVWKEATVTFDSCAVSKLSQHFSEKAIIFDQKLYIMFLLYKLFKLYRCLVQNQI
ncbi:Hypothetical protein FNO222_1667 [Francisella orientalis]|uniref:Uncharacterized protein n=1 Tax=Francisella orientalis TaxID=299583 RepID=A0ABM5U7N9_9GAMM|nr:hypothetical protein M973_09060 [Francisella orientalis LADL 07-285A]AKN86174.1 hypothetical protein FNO12_1652 [Francisella orientalis FNO12]AKN87712.1 Hypothetical protein FNO24_1654 [Francisella orientalis FNO24]AKN89250.1 Hypothetical protein FNO190_1652 [Francisella orientalis]AKU06009.1 Hypothetical protein FNO01_1652 [Francisella orientalis]